MIAALYVRKGGCYRNLEGVDPWDEARDARLYAGPWPVVAHPPCQRWGRFWHGSTRKPHQFRLGDDGGCFKAALRAVQKFGGVLEHPADSHAWRAFGLSPPPRAGGWVSADLYGYTCYVEQGHYGHFSRKPTWLYVSFMSFRPDLIWGPSPQRLRPCAMIGGKNKTEIRNATPIPFRDLLLSIAASANREAAA